MGQSSKWHIWDFHLHTPFSILNSDFGDAEDPDTWEKYVTQITAKAQEKGIAALGITDYFTIEGYKKVLSLKESGRLGDIFIFPNIEFRVDKVIYSTRRGSEESKRLNLHVLISPEIPPQEIEENFLHDLDFCHDVTPFEPPNTRKLKLNNLIEFGRSLREQQPSFQERTDAWVGCMNIVVKTEQIKERLDSRFRGKYLLVLADENLSEMSWQGQDHAVRKQLIQMSHAVFSSNEGTREFCLGERHSSQDEFINEFKSLKPCFWGCDSHSYSERFLEPDDKRYCWIKAKPSWEGLKQVLYEPDERVRIQPEYPEAQKSSFTLDSLKINKSELNSSLTIDNLSVELNSNLITIIGGRGSGKTALLDIIASCFQEGKKLFNLETSFVHRLYGQKGKTKPATSPINLSLTFRSQENYEATIGAGEFQPFERSDILYLTQNHFEEYSANPKKLNEHILALVFDDLPDHKASYENKQRDLITIEQEIQNINLRTEQLFKEISEKEEVALNNLKMKIGEKDDITLRISSVESRQEQSDDAIRILTDKLEELKNKRVRIDEVLRSLQQFEIRVSDFNQFYEGNVLSLNNQIASLNYSDDLKELPIDLKDLSAVIECLSGNKRYLEVVKTNVGEEVFAKNQEISALEGVSKTIADLRQKMTALNVEIHTAETEILEINNKKEQLNDLNDKRIELYVNMLEKMLIIKHSFQRILDEFENGKDEILSNLQFSAFIDLRGKAQYVQQLADKLDNRAHSQIDLEHLLADVFESIDTLFGKTEEQILGDESSKDLCIEVAREIESKTRELRLKRSVTNSDYLNAVFTRFFDLGVEIRFNCKSIDSLSMGERAIVLLKILLSLDDKPLLIDQPEEHLDNRFIFNELVPAFRSAKRRRQILIATHNANLVVNTDAEQIIVAESDAGLIKYTCGAIEDSNIRDKITQLLEGGELAFKKREEKYGYKF
ncbi:TrlF family AAA-like ATPase [Nodosilinea nodulosa]|uniref:TrlF family AAA-like ATPase n=1 Tax=Nodosilinea nodulosa TaxID=416001 RepID=UPI0002F9F9FD|nr:AAA family ATPase [Nodosilinea nodulosa]